MKQFLEYIIPNLVTHPEDVQVTEEEREGVIHLMIQVNPEDVGRVIGKSGKIIKSLRQLVRVMAIKQGVRVNVDVVDSGDQVETPQAETQQESSDEVETPQAETQQELGDEVETPDMEETEEVVTPEVSTEEDLEVPQMEIPEEDELATPPEDEA